MIGRLAFKGLLWLWELVARARDPYVKRWQEKDTHHQIRDEAADDHNRKRSLRVRTDGVRESCRQQSKRCYKHGHHDGTKPEYRAVDRGVRNGVTARTKLIDVFEHNDTGLNR